MKSTTWMQEPHNNNKLSYIPILHTTIKTLLDIASKFKKYSKPICHQTEFKCAVVVARIKAIQPKLILIDNTGILVNEVTKYEKEGHVLLRNTYYRFIFQFTPYTSDSLLLVKIDQILPLQITVHLANIVTQQLKNYANQKQIQANVDHSQSNSLFSNNDFKKVKIFLQSLSQFTKQQVLQTTGVKEASLDLILQNLSNSGEIGNYGSYYIVIKEQYENEPMEIEK